MICRVCSGTNTEAVNHALLEGRSLREVAETYGHSQSSVFRHKQNHLPATLAKARELQDIDHADDLFSQLRSLGERAIGILETAEAAGDLRAATSAIREARACLETQAKLNGKWAEQRHLHAHMSIPLEVLQQINERLAEEQRNPRPRLDFENSPHIHRGEAALPRAIEVGSGPER